MIAHWEILRPMPSILKNSTSLGDSGHEMTLVAILQKNHTRAQKEIRFFSVKRREKRCTIFKLKIPSMSKDA